MPSVRRKFDKLPDRWHTWRNLFEVLMPDSYYRTGQAAAVLGISSYAIRRLCAAGLVEAEFTGKQWRIAVSEIERLKREGVPPIPGITDDNAPRHQRPDPPLLAPPSQAVVTAAEESLTAEHELKRLKLEREAVELRDFFAARNAAERQRQEQAEREAVEAETRREWSNRWLAYGLRKGYRELPELDPEIAQLVTDTLAGLSPEQPDFVVQRVIDGAISKLLEPHVLRWKRENAVEEACTAYSLPYGFRNDPAWSLRARQAALAAVEGLPAGVSQAEMRSAAARAIEPLIAEFEQKETEEEQARFEPWRRLAEALLR